MSYASLINVASGSNQESFQRIRDFIGKRNGTYDYSASGIGWTLHDSSYATDEDTLTAGDYVVFTSPGENGRQALYVQFVFQATYIKMQGWHYWNNITHAGVRANGSSSNNIYTPAGACVLWILGDLDAFYIANTNGSTNYLAGCGCVKPGDGCYDNTIAIAPSAVSTGSSVVVPVDIVPSAWAAGKKLYHWDSAGINVVTIEAVGAGSVTLASVATGKLAGSRLAGDLCVFCTTSNTFIAASVSANRSTGAVTAATNYNYAPGSIITIPVDAFNNRRQTEPVYIFSPSDMAYGVLPHICLTSTTGATQGAVYTDQDGVTYRLLRTPSYAYLVREQ